MFLDEAADEMQHSVVQLRWNFCSRGSKHHGADNLCACLQNSLLVRAGQTESFDALRLESLPMPGGLFGANSTWKRNMSFFSQHQAEKKENIGTAGGPPQMALAVSQEDAMRLAQQEVDGG